MTGVDDRNISVWRLSWRVARWRPALFRQATFWWACFFTVPALTWYVGGKAYDAVEAGDMSRVTTMALALLICEALQFVFLYRGVIVFVRLYALFESLLQVNMLTAQVASGRPESGRPVASAGESIARFRDDTQDVGWFIDSWLDVFGWSVFGAIGLAMMLNISVPATLAALVPMASVVVVTAMLDSKVKKYRRADREATAVVTGFLGDVMSAATTIKVADKADRVTDRLAVLAERRRRTAVKDRVLEDSISAWSSGSVDVALALVIVVSARALVSGDFGLGDLATFFGLLWWMAGLPRMVGRMLARSKQAEVAFEGMRQLVADADPERLALYRPLPIGVEDEPVIRPDNPRIPLERLTVTDLSVRYPDGSGLDPISFTVERGSFTVITGAVGSGKSVLLRALVGLLDDADAHVSGSVAWNGFEIADRAGFFQPPQSAYLSQVPQLLSDSVRDNIRLGVDHHTDLLDHALELAAVHRDIAEMPDGLDTMIGPRGLRLSGGQRQRVAAARALVHRPELIVLDDISSALDVETEVTLWNNLADAGATVLAVSHRKVAFDRADQLIDLN